MTLFIKILFTTFFFINSLSFFHLWSKKTEFIRIFLMPGIKLNFMVIFRERIFKQFVENLFKKCKKTENENKI